MASYQEGLEDDKDKNKNTFAAKGYFWKRHI